MVKRALKIADKNFYETAKKANWTTSGDGCDDDKFEIAWNAILKQYSSFGQIDIFKGDAELKEEVKNCAKYWMAKKSLSFDGILPQDGFGMQALNVRDVSGEDTATIQPFNRDGVTPLTNWEVSWGGALATGAFTGGNLRTFCGGLTASGARGLDQASDQYATRIGLTPRDIEDDEWMPVWWGVGDYLDSKLIDFLRLEMDKEIDGDISLEPLKAMDDKPIMDTGMLIAHTPGNQYHIGAFVNNDRGLSAHYLIGVCFGGSNRFRQNQPAVAGTPQTGLRYTPRRV